MLETTDAVDADAFAGEIGRTLNVRFGDEEKGRPFERDHDSFERRSLARSDDSGRVTGEIIDLAARKRGYRQGAGHLNKLSFETLFLEQSSIAGNENIEERNAERGISQAHFFGVLRQGRRAECESEQNAEADGNILSESRELFWSIRARESHAADYNQRAEMLSMLHGGNNNVMNASGIQSDDNRGSRK